MLSLSQLDEHDARSIRYLAFDLDDTLLTKGRLTADAYQALCALDEAKIELILCTGRPSRWAEVLVRQWPLVLAVAENGGVRIARDKASDQLDISVEANAPKLSLPPPFADEFERTDDCDDRRSDTTFDIGEHRIVPNERVKAFREYVEGLGFRSFASSVHVHVTAAGADKANGIFALLRDHRGIDPAALRTSLAYIGDSENDAACFNAFAFTFGVANVASHLDRLTLPPKYLASAAMGAGFCEIAAAIIGKRTY